MVEQDDVTGWVIVVMTFWYSIYIYIYEWYVLIFVLFCFVLVTVPLFVLFCTFLVLLVLFNTVFKTVCIYVYKKKKVTSLVFANSVSVCLCNRMCHSLYSSRFVVGFIFLAFFLSSSNLLAIPSFCLLWYLGFYVKMQRMGGCIYMAQENITKWTKIF